MDAIEGAVPECYRIGFEVEDADPTDTYMYLYKLHGSIEVLFVLPRQIIIPQYNQRKDA